MEKYPFFALLLMYVKFVSVSDMKKMSTNGRCIYFSPDFLDRLYDYELDYILCHQIVHLVYGHIFRPLDYSGDDYHFACDIQANAFLSELGFCIERHPHLGNLYDEIPGVDLDPKELSPVQIHSLVPYSLYAMDERSRDRFLPDNDIWWDQKEDNGRCGDIVLDLPELDGMLKEENGADILVVSQDGNGG
ncbi:MAG: hypothetical protein IJO50_04390, partial [Clostridia bacterium]|nr:hypothetical protein [Clostridia bacterium]